MLEYCYLEPNDFSLKNIIRVEKKVNEKLTLLKENSLHLISV